ncbi:energy-coupling factor transporter ATPase [Amphibacillus sp. Q70]|uniref:energy-coupling factor transporter ATPase n=1 Tax=Amphibacillus sp. Q70 TaxID=3453416 RepID=UPI003F87A165
MRIKFEEVKADYQLGPIRTSNIIDNVSIDLPSGTFTAVIGRTGAGKSSLLKLINGLLSPSTGLIQVGNINLTKAQEKEQLNQVRKRVGMVFQFPENQLFAETVEADIAFGPRNFGFSQEQIKVSVQESLNQVGLSADILDRSPFALSGGQQRRVALAGVLATQPDVLVLDEPGAGLDSEGKKQILSLIKQLNHINKLTIILVTHDMNDVAEYTDHVLLMDQGKVISHQPTRTFFSHQAQLVEWEIDLPEVINLQRQIEMKKGLKLPTVSLTKTELINLLIEGKIL